jgi:hypothetical protein
LYHSEVEEMAEKLFEDLVGMNIVCLCNAYPDVGNAAFRKKPAVAASNAPLEKHECPV